MLCLHNFLRSQAIGKNQMIKSLISLLFLSWTSWNSAALASGRTVGNGGNIVLCKISDKEYSYELLDFYESRVMRHIQPDFFELGKNIDQKMDIILKRLEKLSPERARLYRSYYASFLSEVQWIQEGGLNTIPDSDHIISPPPGCLVRQTVNQSQPLLPYDKRYFVDQEVWDHLDDNQKTGLILHEIIYREALSIGHVNSVSTRYLNSFISSSQMDQISVREFNKLLKDLGFTTNSIHGVAINLKMPVEFYQNDQLKNAEVVNGSYYLYQGQQISVRDQISFYPNGQLESLFLAEPQDLVWNTKTLSLAPFELQFYETGSLKRMTLRKPTFYKDKLAQLTLHGTVDFYQNGHLKKSLASGLIHLGAFFETNEAVIEGPTQLDEDGTPRFYVLTTAVHFRGFGYDLEITGQTQADSTGFLTLFALAREQNLKIQRSFIRAAPFSNIKVENRQIRSLKLAESAWLLNQKHTTQKYERGSWLQIDSEGLVIP